MYRHDLVFQPNDAHLGHVVEALQHPGAASLDVAVAYASRSGVQALLEDIAAANPSIAWSKLPKRWLIGIDWLRSDPDALDRLQALPKSEVRIFDGARVVDRPGCHPLVSWHPKVFMVRGKTYRATVQGSANLSRNGLLNGHEVGSHIAVASPSNASERAVWDLLGEGHSWFSAQWATATPYGLIQVDYATRHEDEALKRLVPSDDDTSDSGRIGEPRGETPEKLRSLRVATNFWLETGNITKNRGPLQPGNQLMMSRMTRVFFGIAADDVPVNTHFGTVELTLGGSSSHDCPLRFSDNAMDVLTMPLPEPPWPTAYDNQVLLFTRQAHGSGPATFSVTVGTAAEARRWRNASASRGTLYKMAGSGRQYGVF